MTNEQKVFIEHIASAAQACYKEYHILPSLVIAMAIKESGWGKSQLAAKNFNYFGMKCGSSWRGKSVNLRTKEEYTAGVLTTIRDNFRAYDSMEEGVRGYFDFISTKRYANLHEATTPRQYLEMIKADGYATSSSYVATNMNVIEKYGLTVFDDIVTYKPITPDLINAIIDGVFGVGAARIVNLTNEGYDAKAVQDKVNELYKFSKELEPYKQHAGEYWSCVVKFTL